MTASNPELSWQEFVAAIASGKDEYTEQACARLTPWHQSRLLALLDDGDDARWWAVRSLAAVGDAATIAPIAAALEDRDASTRAAAALALGHLAQRHPEAATAVLAALGQRFADSDGFVRQQAVEGMAMAGINALPVLEQLLDVGNPAAVRVRAAAALRHMRDPRCARLLFPLLNDDNHLVHTYAYEALEDLGMLDNVLLAP